MTPRDVARRVLERVEREGAWATPALDGELARAGLDDRDRRLASELVYGVLRHRTRLDRAIAAHAELKRTPPKVLIALRLAAYQLLFLDRVPAYAAVDDAVKAARDEAGPKVGGFVNAVLRKVGQDKEPPLPEVGADTASQLARLEIEYSLPRWILDELFRAVGGRGATMDEHVAAELLARAAAFAEPAPLVARANVRKTTRDAVIAELAAAGVTATPVDIADAPVDIADAPVDIADAPVDIADAPATRPDDARSGGADRGGRANAAGADTGESATRHAGASRTPAAIRIEGLGDPARNPAFVAGRWTVQDSGAQLVAQIADPRSLAAAVASRAGGDERAGESGSARAGESGPARGLRILDACAGVGGKSTHLAELTDDAAIIDAADLNATKLGLLDETAQRLGLRSIRRHTVDLLDASIWGAKLATTYDLIVLDAPCTGLGVLRRHPDAKWRVKPDDVRRMAELQRLLLDAVVTHLAPGGVLVYSVCTFTRAEGPEQMAAFAQRHGLSLVEEHRSWPPDADAFYVARLEAV